ncbi:enoyl-CoA hydratase/isomerase family protein 28 [Achromobacter xylosoxidans A8]|uniref:Enoyl-CoA hydratase/isomerase family protein 28 n=1 Tax=Achromobacter xylosoxidans (strain A8) TaxID=762376 RepID=E3HMN3_ACHXA|nr:enoyl-CoA hydratase/isomerase family protein [Achromobacter xylosoxidans]ADP18260.1 enoyl-CoA hydratase/isomerase family protein 28 [Achromobacter xylosoxidans A8]
MYEGLLYEIEDGVGTITLNRPESKNAIDIAMRTSLRKLVHELRHDRDLKVLILTGAGGNFCSGGDLKALRSSAADGEATAQGRRQRLVDLHDLVSALLDFDRPVISAVQGVAYGAGLGLALTGDLVLAADDARFCMAFGRLGAVADFGTFYTLPRLVGVQRAKELLFSAREFGATEARELGLVLETMPAEDLPERARAIARCLAQASPVALSITKRALNVSLRSDLQTMLMLESDGQGVAMSANFHAMALQRFFDKKGPPFQWPVRQ